MEKHTSRRLSPGMMALPGILYLISFFVIPLAYLLRYSFYRYDPNTLFQNVFTAENYIKFFSQAYYRQVFIQSFELAFIVSILAVIFAYPVSYYLVRSQNKMVPFVSALVYLPLLASSVVTSFGWMIILSDHGMFNNMLIKSGLMQTPLHLMYSKAGVIIALLQAYLPFMITSIRNVLYTVDVRTEEASNTLGAGPIRTFFHITLPLSMSGIASGMLLVFVGVLSAFVTPQLIGGGKINTLASIILREAQVNVNWPMAASISLTLLLVAGVALFLQNKLFESKWMGGGGRK